MNKRIFLVGLAGGLLVIWALYYPLYLYLPHQYVEGWRYAYRSDAIGYLVAAGILLLLTGVVAGRMSGARNRLGAAGAGLVAGLIAALLAEIFLGGPAAGVWGSRLMLQHGLHATQDDAEFLTLLSHGVISAGWATYLSIWIATGAGLLLGGLGGLVGGAGGPAAQPQPRLWLTISAVAVLSSAANLVVMISVYVILGPILQDVADRIAGLFIPNYTLPYPAESLTIWASVTSLVWLLFWQLIAWLNLRRLPTSRSISFASIMILVLLSSIVPALAYAVLMNPLFGFYSEQSDLPTVPLFTGAILLALAGGILWGATKIEIRPRKEPLRETRLRLFWKKIWSKVQGFFARVGDVRLAAWYFLLLALLTTFLVFIVSDRDGILLPWLAGGLGVGVIFAAFGIYDTWTIRPAPLEEPLLPIPRETFWTASVNGVLNSLLALLNSLTPFNLVLIPVVMIASLMLRDEAQVVASTGTQSLSTVVEASYRVPQYTALMAGLVVIFVSLLATAVDVVRVRLRKRDLPPETFLEKCLNCGRTRQEVPLLQVLFQDKAVHVCPQCLPVLIHKPSQLADKLPGLENIQPPQEKHAAAPRRKSKSPPVSLDQ